MEFIPACSLVAVYLKAENIRDQEFRNIIGQFGEVQDAANVAKFFQKNDPYLGWSQEANMPDHFYLIVDPGKEDYGQAVTEDYAELNQVCAGVYSF